MIGIFYCLNYTSLLLHLIITGTGQFPPGQLPTGQLPPPAGQLPPIELPPRKIPTYENFPQIIAPGQFTPRIIDPLDR